MDKKEKNLSSHTANHHDITSTNDKADALLRITSTNLERLLDEQKITAKDLALKTGYSEAAISNYRRGKKPMTLDFLIELRDLYHISIDEFLSKEISSDSFRRQIPQSYIEEAEESSCKKFSGTYLVYYLNTNNYKGRDTNTPDESLLFGVISISTENAASGATTAGYSCLAVLGLTDRYEAADLQRTLKDKSCIADVEKYVFEENAAAFAKKAYIGVFDLSAEHAFITLTHDRKDKALIILHRVNSNKEKYIGGMGTINSVSKGRESMPTVQYIAFSRYPISLSSEEIHHQLLLGTPVFKADSYVKDFIALFKKTYMADDPAGDMHTELEKELIIKVNFERYVKNSLKNNLFRYAKISERDDDFWYDLLKEVSITED